MSIPCLEALHMSVGIRDGFGMVLVYCAPCNPAFSFLELVDLIAEAALRFPRLIVLGDFNVHAEDGATDLIKAFDLVSKDGLFKILPKIGRPS